MNHNPWRSAAILVAGVILISTSFGADKVRGTGAAGKEMVSFAYGWGLLKSDKNEVNIGFSAKPLPSELESKVKAEKSFFMGVDESAGPMTVNLQPKSGDGKISRLSGDLKKGGIITGVLKGGSLSMNGTKFTWDLEFSTALRTP